jgi:hypothetical protein
VTLEGMTSYAVIWREGNGPLYAGKLELGAAALRLRGSGPRSSLARRDIAYADVAEVRIARTPTERLNGGPAVVLDRRAAAPIIVVAALSGVGVVFELADLLAGHKAEQTASASRVAVAVPIKAETRERVRGLIDAGPPFDADDVGLDRHHVFVTEREVIFVFEGQNVRSAVRQLARDARFWKAAAWRDCIAGRPRIAEEAYSWVTKRRR